MIHSTGAFQDKYVQKKDVDELLIEDSTFSEEDELELEAMLDRFIHKIQNRIQMLKESEEALIPEPSVIEQ